MKEITRCFKDGEEMRQFILYFVFLCEGITAMTLEVSQRLSDEDTSRILMSQLLSLCCFLKLHPQCIKNLIDCDVPQLHVDVFKKLIEAQIGGE